jgi:hypothetical protein
VSWVYAHDVSAKFSILFVNVPPIWLTFC